MRDRPALKKFRSPFAGAALTGTALALVLCAASPPSQGEIFRWIDGNGVTHFSQTPPPSGRYEQMQPPPPPAEDPAKARARINKVNQHIQDQLDRERKQAQADRQARQNEAQRAKACQQSKRRLTALTIRPHVLVKSSNGQFKRMSESQRQAAIKEARDRIAKYCPR